MEKKRTFMNNALALLAHLLTMQPLIRKCGTLFLVVREMGAQDQLKYLFISFDSNLPPISHLTEVTKTCRMNSNDHYVDK